jgi:hypothetical protein
MKNDKLIDLFTGVVFGGLLGLYYPLGDHHTILVILAVVMGLRFFSIATK